MTDDTQRSRNGPGTLRRPKRPLRWAAISLLAIAFIGCRDVNLIATPSPTTAPVPVVPTASVPAGAGLVFVDPACVEYDDYQSAAMAFYSLSAIVQDGLDSASAELAGETLDSAVARFEATVRLALKGETIAEPDPIEELALFWVASDGCMR